MNNSTENSFDIAIVGGGPAGSSLAIRLAANGLKVLLAEQKKFPREKLCGEFISPECLSHFRELGVAPRMLASGGTEITETVFYSRNGKGAAVPTEWLGGPNSNALGLSRAAMDDQLLDRTIESGVDVRQETTAILDIGNPGSQILKLKDRSGAETIVSAKLVIDATGRSRSLARKFNKAKKQEAAEFVAFKTHLRGASIAEKTCEIYAYPGGYGGCNRVEDGLYNLCFIATAASTRRLKSDPEAVMRTVVFANRRAEHALSKAEVVRPWLAVPIERFGRGELAPANGILTVGDASSFIDPFTGSGMLMAFESSRIAAAEISLNFAEGYDFDRLATAYERRYAASFGSRLRFCSMLRYAAFVPFLAETTISVLRMSGGFRKRVARATRFSAGPAV